MSKFYIEAIETGTIQLNAVNISTTDNFYYGIDNEATPNLYVFGNSISVQSGEKVYWYAPNRTAITNPNQNYQFSISNRAKLGGNISSLNNNWTYAVSDYCLQKLFKGCTSIVDASELVLDITDFNNKSYVFQNLFYGCTSITKPPQFPLMQSGKSLGSYCYYSLFNGCISLNEPPILPETNLGDSCYGSMFRSCRALQTAPSLPATTLKTGCYSYMFYACTSLVNAPELPATTLTPNCYADMFRSCNSLVNAPELPALSLHNYCYSYMFNGCVSLEIPPELPATALARSCYEYMFSSCSKIKLSATQTSEYHKAYRIPKENTGTELYANTTNGMFSNTGGTYTGTPQINTTYYLSAPYDVILTSGTGGSSDYSRSTSNKNIVTFNSIPNTHYTFTKYTINGVDYTTTPLQMTLTESVVVTSTFTPDPIYYVTLSTNIENGSVYQSATQLYSGEQVMIMARPYPNYNFKQWSDGNTQNPRTITISNNDITLVAEYEHEIETNAIYQYRCFVKDQMSLTSPPKSFMVVRSFNINNDLLTNSNSSIQVYEVDGDINNGDILVLYNPFGETIYQGVIYAMSDTTIQCHQMQNFYAGNWIYNVHPSANLETEIAYLLGQYAQGKIYGSTYTDNLVAQRLGGITIQSTPSLTANLPTDLDDEGNPNYSVIDMEKFIYSLYQDYGIIFDFEINFSGANYVRIKVPTYSSIKVGNNNYAIKDLSPITQIEENNRLIIFSKDKTYRTTYVATNNSIVEEPTSLVGRFDITNTKVVFSDDNVADLIASNLPSTMYNHKVTFTLILKNSLYTFKEFNLGMPLDIWNYTDYYNSVLTGYSLKKGDNVNPTSVNFTCGKVRQALTKKLSLGVSL